MADAIVEAAPITDENDDNWLYGDPNAEPADGQENKEAGPQLNEDKEGVEDGPPGEDTEAGNDDSHFNDEHFADEEDTPQDENDNGENESQLNGDSDSDDDGVKVVIGVTAAQPYQPLNIKRGGLVPQSIEKTKPVGKYTVEEMEAVGTINGVPAQEFNLDVIEDKPWRKPGADLSDYFNYGFSEDTWRAYCEKQRRMRVVESGVGLGTLGVRPFMHNNEHKFYQQSPGPRRPAPGPMTGNGQYGMHPPGPNPGMINVISGPGPQYGRPDDPNMRTGAIQVMTADRRKYTRGKFPDMSLPPPAGEFFPGSEDGSFYPNQPSSQYMGDEQWGSGGGGGWQPTDIKELTPGPPMGIPPPNMGPPHSMGHPNMGPPNMGPPNMGPPNMGPPNMGPPNMGPPNMGPPHMVGPPMVPAPNMGGMPPMMGPPGHGYGPSHMGPMGPMGPHSGDRDRERDRREDPEYRERRDRERERREEEKEERERERDRGDRGERGERERERDRDRGRSRSIKPDRHREKSHRRERSRSRERSRRHKSRSRSPVRHRETSPPPPSSRHRDSSPPPSSRHRESSPPPSSRHRESPPPPTRHRDSSPPSSRHRDAATPPPPKTRDRERSAKPKSKRKEKEESD